MTLSVKYCLPYSIYITFCNSSWYHFADGPVCELIQLSNIEGGNNHYHNSYNFVSCEDCYLFCDVLDFCTAVTCEEESSSSSACYFYAADKFVPSGNKDAFSWIKKCTGTGNS